MATLKRSHAPVPWGAHVETMVWEKSKSGTPRRRRSDRPPLIHDPGWDWDGTRISFSGEIDACDWEDRDHKLWKDEYSPVFSEGMRASLSLLDIAQYQGSKRRCKARSGLGDFEVVRIPKVVPVSEEGPGLSDCCKLGEWEKLDVFGLKRTYSEVAQGFTDRNDPLMSSYSRFGTAPSSTEDDSWECL